MGAEVWSHDPSPASTGADENDAGSPAALARRLLMVQLTAYLVEGQSLTDRSLIEMFRV